MLSPIDALGDASLAARALAWRVATLRLVCDVFAPWEYGTLVRATPFPNYYEFNQVLVQHGARPAAEELIAFADRALAGLAHRKLSFDSADAGQPLRAAFETQGWKSTRMLMMRHGRELPSGQDAEVQEMPYEAVDVLRLAWHEEDFPGSPMPLGFLRQSREVARRRGSRVLAVVDDGGPVAYAQLDSDGAAAEISDVYVHPDHRGRGLGTAVTRAAVQAAAGASDLWICADDEDRPKHLYARLGFEPVCVTLEFLKVPDI